MTRMPPKKVVSSDDFQTPEIEVERMIKFLNPSWKIWECADGKGKIVRTLEKHGFNVTGTDIKTGQDFLAPLFPTPEFDCIFTNPPYSRKDEWIQRCFDIGKPFALLLPITGLVEQGRIRMYKKYGVQVAIPPGRINYETPSGEGSGAWFFSVWICHGLLPDNMVFL